MAKKKAARPARKAATTARKAVRKVSKAAAGARAAATKAMKGARKQATRRVAGVKAAATRAVKGARKQATRRVAAAKATATKLVKRATGKATGMAKKAKAAARKLAASRKANVAVRKVKRKAPVRKAARKAGATRPIPKPVSRPVATPVVAQNPAPKVSARKAAPAKKPNLDRPRRTVAEIHGVPSSLDMDRAASAVRTGRAELAHKIQEHTSTSPALTAGDVDADWAAAESVGDEAPGGDNPTPDQDVVEEIGRALGVEYDDDEELQGGDEIAERDRHRWELDPGSSDDFEER